jgi:VIT1/CCC1 family predicted Fe2+/Mn2+ transporter
MYYTSIPADLLKRNPQMQEKIEIKKQRKIQLRDIILGGQDGLVNILGLSLGLFAAHSSGRIIIIAALAAGFSEAVSMGAVAYTSASADETRQKAGLLFDSVVVGITALIGAILPIIPFFFLSGNSVAAVIIAIIISACVLFGFGISKAKVVGGNPWRSGLQILLIGLVSAFAGFLIGWLLGVVN